MEDIETLTSIIRGESFKINHAVKAFAVMIPLLPLHLKSM